MRRLQVETADGLRFFLSIYPSYGWLYSSGTMRYYRMDTQTAEWFSRNFN